MIIQLSYHMPYANGKKNIENPWEIYRKSMGNPVMILASMKNLSENRWETQSQRGIVTWIFWKPKSIVNETIYVGKPVMKCNEPTISKWFTLVDGMVDYWV